MMVRQRWRGVVLVLAVFMLLAVPPHPATGRELVVASPVGSPASFHGAVASGYSTALVSAQLFASPLRQDHGGRPQPYLAERWELAPDNLSLTLHLRRDAFFHDGVPITSADLAFSIQTIKQYHPLQSLFSAVQAVETPGPHTAVIRLKSPHPALFIALTPLFCPVLPKHIYDDGQDLRSHPANLTPVGSGPFSFVSYRPGEELRLKRFERFFVADRPRLKELTFLFGTTLPEMLVGLERGRIHVLPFLTDPAAIDRLQSQPDLLVSTKGYEAIGGMGWLAFNLLREPLSDQRVRQAIAHAIDRRFIVEFLHRGRSQMATGPIAPNTVFYEPEGTTSSYDLERAERLLDQAGYRRQGEEQIRFTLSLDFPPVMDSQFRDVVFYLRRQLERIGIRVELRPGPSFAAWRERVANWNFDLTLDGVSNYGDPLIGVHRSYLSTNIRKGVMWSNTQNYRNPKVDALLEQAAMEMDIDKRRQLYREFQQLVRTDLPVLPLTLLPMHTVVVSGLAGLPDSIWGIMAPLDELHWRRPLLSEDVSPLDTAAALPAATDDIVAYGTAAVAAVRRLGEARGFAELTHTLATAGENGVTRSLLAVTHGGYVFHDSSGVFPAGADINGLKTFEGEEILKIFTTIGRRAGGPERVNGGWPHPLNHGPAPFVAWCGQLDHDDLLCVLDWDDRKGGRP